MNWSNWIRWAHRWLAIAFTLIVIGIIALLGFGQQPAEWIYYLPLPPLFLMLATGLYLFALPYVRRMRAGRRTA